MAAHANATSATGERNPGPKVVVEVAVDSVAGALAAVAGGADRLELCADLHAGGLTPSLGLCEEVVAAVRIPVFAMLRPRPGDFLYDRGEFAAMRRDAVHLRRAGAAGLVAGVLQTDGTLDGERMAELLAAAAGAPFTCHRAFDVCRDADAALEQLVALGVARVLTSGQAANALAGAPVIRRLVARAAGRITVLAGAGVRDGNVRELVAASGVREVHLSATAWVASGMVFRRDGVPMGGTDPADEYSLRTTDGAMVARVVQALASMRG